MILIYLNPTTEINSHVHKRKMPPSPELKNLLEQICTAGIEFWDSRPYYQSKTTYREVTEPSITLEQVLREDTDLHNSNYQYISLCSPDQHQNIISVHPLLNQLYTTSQEIAPVKIFSGSMVVDTGGGGGGFSRVYICLDGHYILTFNSEGDW